MNNIEVFNLIDKIFMNTDGFDEDIDTILKYIQSLEKQVEEFQSRVSWLEEDVFNLRTELDKQ